MGFPGRPLEAEGEEGFPKAHSGSCRHAAGHVNLGRAQRVKDWQDVYNSLIRAKQFSQLNSKGVCPV